MDQSLGPIPPPPPLRPSQSSANLSGPRTGEGTGGLLQPVVHTGSGVFANGLVGTPPPALSDGPGVELNFVDADIGEVARAILTTTLGRSYVIDPSVKGTITLQTSGPIDRQDVVGVLDQALRVNGAALTEKAGVFYVLPQQMIGNMAPVAVGNRPPGMVRGYRIQVIPTAYVDPSQLVDLLKPLLGENHYLHADPARHLLLVAGTEAEVRTVQELVRTFDADWFAGMSFGVFPLDQARAADVAQDMSLVLTGDPANAASQDLRILPIDRLNAVLVISRSPAGLKNARELVGTFDHVAETDDDQIFVYYAHNSDAEKLAATIGQIYGATGASATPGQSGPTAPGLGPAVLGGATGGDLLGGAGSSGGLAAGDTIGVAGAAGGLGAGGLGGAAAYGGTGGGAFQQAAASASSFSIPGVSIVADTDKNAIIVRTTPRRYREIEQALEQLDRAPLQVLVEVTIAEVTLNNQLRYGVQWFLQHGDVSAFFTRAALPVAPLTPGFALIFDSSDIRVLLDALSTITTVSVISSPSLLVVDNQQARLNVGDQVPIATQSAVSVLNPDAPIVNSVQYRDTGVILEVMPRVSSNDMVTLDVRQEVSDVVPTNTSGIDSPTIQQRAIQSSVSVRSGQTIALGGLIRDRASQNRTGIPYLSETPVLGALFGTKDRTSTRTELIVQLTPRILENDRDLYEASRELRQKMRGFALPRGEQRLDGAAQPAAPAARLPRPLTPAVPLPGA